MSKLVDSKRNPGIILSSTQELTSAQKNTVYVDEASFDANYIPVNFQLDDIVNKQDSKAVIVQFLFRENLTDKKSSYIIAPSGTSGAEGSRTIGWDTSSTVFCSTSRRSNFELDNYGAALTYLHKPYTFDTILPKTAADRNWGILYSNLHMGENTKDTVTNTSVNWPMHRVLTTGFSHDSIVYDISKNYVSPTSAEFTPHHITVTTQLYNSSKASQTYHFSNDIHLNIDSFNNITEFTLGFRGVVSGANLDSYIESLSAAPKYRQLFAIDIKGGELDFTESDQYDKLKNYESLTSQHNEKLYSFNQSIVDLAIKSKRIKENTWYIEDDEFKTFTVNNNVRVYISTANPLDKTSQHNYFTGDSFSTNFNDAKIYHDSTESSADLATARNIAGKECYEYSFRCVTISQPTVEYNSPVTNFTVTNDTYNLSRRFLSCYNGSTVKYYIGDPDPANYVQGDMSQWVDGPYDQTTIFALRNDPNVEHHNYITYYVGPSNMPYHNAIGHSDNWGFSISAATKVRDVDYQTIHDLIDADPILAPLVLEQQVQPWMNYTAFLSENKALEMWQVASADLSDYTFYSQNISAALTNAQLNSIFDRALSASSVATDNNKSFFSVPQMDFIALEYIIKPVSSNS